MPELDHIIRTIPFEHLLLMLAVLDALDVAPSPVCGLRSPSSIL